jgi:hypothetical protein
MEIIVSLEARDLLFFGWTCRISENFYGKGPDFKEMGVLVCLRFAVISMCIESALIEQFGSTNTCTPKNV